MQLRGDFSKRKINVSTWIQQRGRETNRENSWMSQQKSQTLFLLSAKKPWAQVMFSHVDSFSSTYPVSCTKLCPPSSGSLWPRNFLCWIKLPQNLLRLIVACSGHTMLWPSYLRECSVCQKTTHEDIWLSCWLNKGDTWTASSSGLQALLVWQATYLVFVFVFRFSKCWMPSVLYTLKPTLSRQSTPRIVTVATISCFWSLQEFALYEVLSG